jgi:hypothetical protein
MGLLGTRWEAKYEGHNITVSRNELTRGFSLEWDGQESARRVWSLIGLGELHGSAEHAGKPVDVRVALEWGEGIGTDGECKISVDGKPIDVKHVR